MPTNASALPRLAHDAIDRATNSKLLTIIPLLLRQAIYLVGHVFVDSRFRRAPINLVESNEPIEMNDLTMAHNVRTPLISTRRSLKRYLGGESGMLNCDMSHA